VVLKLQHISEPLEGLVHGPQRLISDSVGLELGLRICISSKFPGTSDASDLGIKQVSMNFKKIRFFKKSL